MATLKTATGVQFFEDYLLPTNGQTKNKLWEITLLPLAARHTAWLSLKTGIDTYGIINGCRMRIVSTLAKGGAHVIAGAQCIAIGSVAAVADNLELLAYAAGGTIVNVYCIAVQGDIGYRVFRLLEKKRKRMNRVQEEDL